jgi:hypothetical protein
METVQGKPDQSAVGTSQVIERRALTIKEAGRSASSRPMLKAHRFRCVAGKKQLGARTLILSADLDAFLARLPAWKGGAARTIR